MSKLLLLILFIVLFITFCEKQDNKNNQNDIISTQNHCYEVITKGIVIRKLPSNNSELIGQLSKYDRVILLEKSDFIEVIYNVKAHWIKIITEDGLKGYVFAGFLKKVDCNSEVTKISKHNNQEAKNIESYIEEDNNSYINEEELVLLPIAKENVQVFEKPDVQSNLITTLYKTQIVQVIKIDRNWAFIELSLEDYSGGWVSLDNLIFNNEFKLISNWRKEKIQCLSDYDTINYDINKDGEFTYTYKVFNNKCLSKAETLIEDSFCKGKGNIYRYKDIFWMKQKGDYKGIIYFYLDQDQLNSKELDCKKVENNNYK